MAKKRFYAVKTGTEIGIFKTLEECKRRTSGVYGAKYKGFGCLDDAEIWMGMRKPVPLERDVLHIWTDGACSGNPGPGGYAFIMNYNNAINEGSGHENYTTNNCMELSAVIEAIKAITKPDKPKEVRFYIDSQYTIDAMNTGNGVANRHMVDAIFAFYGRLMDITHTSIVKVDGHCGNHMNEKVDALAVAARDA